MKKISRIFCLILAVCMLLSMAACGGKDDGTGTANSGGTKTEEQSGGQKTESGGEAQIGKTDIVFANASDINSADPANVSDSTSLTLCKHIYCTLLNLDNEGNVGPGLAESYDIVGDDEYVFHLNEKACFADGTPITAQDVVFTYERARNCAQSKSLLSRLDSITADNEHQVTIKLTEPYALFIYIVANGRLSILSEKAVTAAGDAYGDIDNILSSGAYTMTEWAANDHYKLERNENYWGEMPVTTSITMRVVPEGTARSIMLETGEVDLVYIVDPADVSVLGENKEVTLYRGLSNSVEVIGFNLQNEYLSDIRVRQAISMVINKQEIVDVVQEGNAVVANSILNKNIPGWSEDVHDQPYDIEKAKELMKEAGYENGFTIHHYFFNNTRNRIAQMLQAMLAEINIDLDICAVEGSALFDYLDNGKHDSYDISSGNSNFDCNYTFYNSFHSDNIGASNYIFLNDPDMDKKIEDAARIIDDGEREAAYIELQQEIMDEAYVVPLYYPISTSGARADLKGFAQAANGIYWLGNCYYEK